jgi:HEAT repeat protein/bifunctional DNase/RNase
VSSVATPVAGWDVVLVRSDDDVDERLCEPLASRLIAAGYGVIDPLRAEVGQSALMVINMALNAGLPALLCGTKRAAGDDRCHHLVAAIRRRENKLYVLQLEPGAHLDLLAGSEPVLRYWRDPDAAANDLIAALRRDFPLGGLEPAEALLGDGGARFRQIARELWQPIGDWPTASPRVGREQLQRIYVPLAASAYQEQGLEPGVPGDQPEVTGLGAVQRVLRTWVRPVPEFVPSEANAVGALLGNSRRLVILGEAGAGKSALLRWMAATYLDRCEGATRGQLPGAARLPDRDWFPVLIPCRDVDPGLLLGPLSDVIRALLQQMELTADEAGVLTQDLTRRLRDGHAVLLVDGLDELGDIALRRSFCGRLDELAVAYPEAAIVVTSRLVGYQEARQRLSHFTHLQLDQFGLEDQKQFLREWYGVADPECDAETRASELLDLIHAVPAMAELAARPLLLNAIAQVRWQTGVLPQRRSDLYWSLLRVLLDRRSADGQAAGGDEAITQLAFIAYAMTSRGVPHLRRDEIIGLLKRFRAAHFELSILPPVAFLTSVQRAAELLFDVGAVPYRGRPARLLEFRHRIFREYLTALAILQRIYPQPNKTENIGELLAGLVVNRDQGPDDKQPFEALDDNWIQVARLALQAAGDETDELLRALIAGRNASQSSQITAVICLADGASASDDVADEVLRAFVGIIVRDDARRVRPGLLTTTADLLAGSRWAERAQELLRAPMRETAGAGKIGLMDIYGRIALPAQGRLGLSTADWYRRQAGRLEAGEDDALVAGCLVALAAVTRWKGPGRDSDDEDEDVPQELIDGLLRAVSSGGAAALAAALALRWLNDPQRGHDAWRASPSDLAALTRLLVDPATEPEVLRAILVIAGRERFAPAREHATVLLKHRVPRVRLQAAKALGSLADSESLNHLIDGLADPEPLVRAEIAQQLTAVGDDGAADQLALLTTDGDPDVRLAAVRALARIGGERSITVLVDRLADPVFDVQQAAADALAAIGDAGVARAFASWLAGVDDARLRARYVAVLGELGGQPGIRDLAQFLIDPARAVRKAAADALGTLSRTLVTDVLVPLLTSSGTPAERWLAAVTLGHLGSPRAARVLVDHLTDEDPRRRLIAAEALANVDTPAAIDALADRLTDPSERVETLDAAVRRLIEVRDTRLVDGLAAALADPHSQVRQTSFGLLVDVLGQGAVPYVDLLLRDRDPAVREAALDLLDKLGPDTAIKQLTTLAAAPRPDTRLEVLRRLARHHPDNLAQILAPHLRDPDARVIKLAASWLAETRDAEATRMLISALGDTDTRVRMAAALALGVTDDPRVVGALAECHEDPDREVRVNAVRAIGMVAHRQPEAAVASLEDFAADRDSQVRFCIVESLLATADATWQFGSPRPAITSGPIVSLLIRLARDPDDGVSIRAIEALGRAAHPAAAEVVTDLLTTASDAFLRRTALDALAQMRADVRIDLIAPYLRDEDEAVRFAAVAAIGAIDDPAAGDILRELFEHDDQWMRVSAAGRLAGSGDAEALEVLARDHTRALSTIRQLIDRGDPRGTEQLAAVLSGGSEEFTCRSYISELLKQPSPERVAAVLSLLDHPHSVTRYVAAEQLPAAVPDPDRLAADAQPGESLGESDDRRAADGMRRATEIIEQMARLLTDRMNGPRMNVAMTLGSLRHPAASSALMWRLGLEEPKAVSIDDFLVYRPPLQWDLLNFPGQEPADRQTADGSVLDDPGRDASAPPPEHLVAASHVALQRSTDRSAVVRIAMAQALGEIGRQFTTPEHLTALETALTDQVVAVRLAAAMALAATGTVAIDTDGTHTAPADRATAAHMLAFALDDQATAVRAEAAGGLLALDDLPALRTMTTYFDDPVTAVRHAAWDASIMVADTAHWEQQSLTNLADEVDTMQSAATAVGANSKKMEVVGVRREQPSDQYVVLLKEINSDRYLPCWIGAVEGVAIVSGQQGNRPLRPLTHDLFCDALKAAGVRLVSVTFVELKDGIIYANLILSNGAVVSARPSDAIALALRVDAPVFATAEILDEAGIEIPEEQADDGSPA